MDKNELYRDIARRTNGEIYIGVVGPVRTGKSTFIKRFMDGGRHLHRRCGAGPNGKIHLHQALYGRYGDTQHTGRKRQGAANR